MSLAYPPARTLRKGQEANNMERKKLKNLTTTPKLKKINFGENIFPDMKNKNMILLLGKC